MAAKGGGGHGGGGGAGGGGGGGSRAGRSYAMVLMVAFGAAIVGVMILHKFRERRIFNLVLRDKDTQLLSLHLLLQKEKDNAKDARRQMDELKAKMHKLRGKKADLEARAMEMESTISSLREEQKTISSSLEEKKKEIQALMDYKRGQSQETARLVALSQELQRKAAEIEELRQRADLQPGAVKVWSVSSDDPSSLPANFTTRAAREEEEANSSGKSAESSSQRHNQKQDVKNETAEPQQVSGGGDQSRNGVEYESMRRRVRRMGRRRINDGNRAAAAASSDTALNSENGVESVRSGESLTESERKRGSNELGLDEPNGEMYGREMDGRSNLQKKLPANSRAIDDNKFLNKPEN